MNQKTLQNIYRQLEAGEFYRRYLVDLGCRQDRRALLQHRPIKVTRSQQGIVLSCGQTILIASVETSIQQVTYSPVSYSFGEPLLKLEVVSGSHKGRHHHSHEGREEKAIEHYVSSRIKWGPIEDQLVSNDLATNKQYANKGIITLRVLSNDGGVPEYGLIAVQLLLHTQTFQSFTIEKGKVELKDKSKINIDHLVWPLRCVSIIGKCLVDPSLNQQENCSLVLTALTDLKGDRPAEVIRRQKAGQMSQQTVRQMLQVCQKRRQELSLKLDALWGGLAEKGECCIEW